MPRKPGTVPFKSFPTLVLPSCECSTRNSHTLVGNAAFGDSMYALDILEAITNAPEGTTPKWNIQSVLRKNEGKK